MACMDIHNNLTYRRFSSGELIVRNGSVQLGKNQLLEDALLQVCILEIKRLQYTSIEVCISNFQVYRLRERLKDFHTALSETTSQFGIGFQKYQPKPSLSIQNKE